MVAPPPSPPAATDPDADVPTGARKAALRTTMLAHRLEPGAADAAVWSAEAARRALAALAPAPGTAISAFWSLPGEIDTAPLRDGLLAAGADLLLPRLEGRGRPLAFHRWRPGDRLLPGPLGLMQPDPAAPRLRPEVLIVPLLAFDERGYRLGYGGGYYDRTLAALAADGGRPLAAGFAFELQRVERVPVDAHDARLDLMVTEQLVRRFS